MGEEWASCHHVSEAPNNFPKTRESLATAEDTEFTESTYVFLP